MNSSMLYSNSTRVSKVCPEVRRVPYVLTEAPFTVSVLMWKAASEQYRQPPSAKCTLDARTLATNEASHRWRGSRHQYGWRNTCSTTYSSGLYAYWIETIRRSLGLGRDSTETPKVRCVRVNAPALPRSGLRSSQVHRGCSQGSVRLLASTCRLNSWVCSSRNRIANLCSTRSSGAPFAVLHNVLKLLSTVSSHSGSAIDCVSSDVLSTSFVVAYCTCPSGDISTHCRTATPSDTQVSGTTNAAV